MMTLQQTVEIPADHRLFIDVPQEIPEGTARISILFNGFDDDVYDSMRRHHADNDFERSLEHRAEQESFVYSKLPGVKRYKSLAAMRGCCKGLDTMDEYFARKNADKEKEAQQERRYL
jgi:hypothetical protein